MPYGRQPAFPGSLDAPRAAADVRIRGRSLLVDVDMKATPGDANDEEGRAIPGAGADRKKRSAKPDSGDSVVEDGGGKVQMPRAAAVSRTGDVKKPGRRPGATRLLRQEGVGVDAAPGIATGIQAGGGGLLPDVGKDDAKKPASRIGSTPRKKEVASAKKGTDAADVGDVVGTVGEVVGASDGGKGAGATNTKVVKPKSWLERGTLSLQRAVGRLLSLDYVRAGAESEVATTVDVVAPDSVEVASADGEGLVPGVEKGAVKKPKSRVGSKARTQAGVSVEESDAAAGLEVVGKGDGATDASDGGKGSEAPPPGDVKKPVKRVDSTPRKQEGASAKASEASADQAEVVGKGDGEGAGGASDDLPGKGADASPAGLVKTPARRAGSTLRSKKGASATKKAQAAVDLGDVVGKGDIKTPVPRAGSTARNKGRASAGSDDGGNGDGVAGAGDGGNVAGAGDGVADATDGKQAAAVEKTKATKTDTLLDRVVSFLQRLVVGQEDVGVGAASEVDTTTSMDVDAVERSDVASGDGGDRQAIADLVASLGGVVGDGDGDTASDGGGKGDEDSPTGLVKRSARRVGSRAPKQEGASARKGTAAADLGEVVENGDVASDGGTAAAAGGAGTGKARSKASTSKARGAARESGQAAAKRSGVARQAGAGEEESVDDASKPVTSAAEKRRASVARRRVVAGAVTETSREGTGATAGGVDAVSKAAGSAVERRRASVARRKGVAAAEAATAREARRTALSTTRAAAAGDGSSDPPPKRKRGRPFGQKKLAPRAAEDSGASVSEKGWDARFPSALDMVLGVEQDAIRRGEEGARAAAGLGAPLHPFFQSGKNVASGVGVKGGSRRVTTKKRGRTAVVQKDASLEAKASASIPASLKMLIAEGVVGPRRIAAAEVLNVVSGVSAVPKALMSYLESGGAGEEVLPMDSVPAASVPVPVAIVAEDVPPAFTTKKVLEVAGEEEDSALETLVRVVEAGGVESAGVPAALSSYLDSL
ncbi:hypothetical protein T484DRAFT_1898775, partial [Baffinella frigidus]